MGDEISFEYKKIFPSIIFMLGNKKIVESDSRLSICEFLKLSHRDNMIFSRFIGLNI